MIIDDLKSHMSGFLTTGNWQAFFEWFAPLPVEIEDCTEPEAVDFVRCIHQDIVDFDEGVLDEHNLRENIRARLFATTTSNYRVMYAPAITLGEIRMGALATSPVVAETAQR